MSSPIGSGDDKDFQLNHVGFGSFVLSPSSLGPATVLGDGRVELERDGDARHGHSGKATETSQSIPICYWSVLIA